MKTIISAIICIFCVYTSNLYALGDLLMTVQERAQVDSMRSKNAPIIKSNKIIKSIKIDGFFFKNKDKLEKGIVWINGKQITSPELGSGMMLKKINEQDKTISVMFKETRSTTPIKAGQKLVLDDGEIQDFHQQ